MYPHISRVLAEQHTRDLQNEATWAHRRAAMRLRTHRRNLVAWSLSVGTADKYGAPRLTRLARTRRPHRFIRTGALLTVIGLMRLARAARPRWRPLLAGGVLTMVGLMLRSGAWGAVILPGIWFLGSALLAPAHPDADHKRSELERELAVYARSAQLSSWINSAFDARS